MPETQEEHITRLQNDRCKAQNESAELRRELHRVRIALYYQIKNGSVYVRPNRTIRSCIPGNEMAAGPCPYRATFNKHGAASLILDDGLLGVKPEEYEIDEADNA